MPHADTTAVLSRVLALAASPEREPLSEWANEHRVLSSEASASPGPWRTLAFQREPLEPLDAIAPGSPYELGPASQLGKSELWLELLA